MARRATDAAATYQIGDVADRVGLSLRTVRYYEEMGLLSPEGRTDGGFRLYTDVHVERLALIKQMKPLGFTIPEMRDLLAARDKLANPRLSQSTREAARRRLAEFASRATERCDELRGELDQAEAFAKRVSSEARGSRARSVRGG